MHFVLSGGGSGEGDVQQIVTWNQSGYRGGVKVRWKDTKKEGVYRMGGEGCIDVIYINDVMSDQYYLTHLPVVGELINTTCSLALICYNALCVICVMRIISVRHVFTCKNKSRESNKDWQ